MTAEIETEVLIIGAGAAGLAAWRELHQAGVAAKVLEARDRIGGRIWTIRSSGGDGAIELGAEFVHGRPPATFSRVGKLAMVEAEDRRFLSWGRMLGEMPDFWDIIEKIHAQIDPHREISYREFLHSAEGTPFEKQVALSYAEGFNAANASLLGVQAVRVAEDAARAIEGERNFRFAGGYDGFVRGLLGDLPQEQLLLQTMVRSLRWRRGHVEVVAETPHGPVRCRAERVILTIPLGVFLAPEHEPGAIAFQPPLAGKREAMRGLEAGRVVKIVMQFREVFWRMDAGFAMKLDAPIPTWWTQAPGGQKVLTGWAGGPAAERLSALPHEQMLDRALNSIGAIFGVDESRLRALNTGIHYHDWEADPFARGAYSYPRVRGLEAARALAAPIESTLFFAGEATDWEGRNGTVDGALASGERAAKEVLSSRATKPALL